MHVRSHEVPPRAKPVTKIMRLRCDMEAVGAPEAVFIDESAATGQYTSDRSSISDARVVGRDRRRTVIFRRNQQIVSSTTAKSASSRQERLFGLLRTMVGSGARIAPIGAVDERVDCGEASLFLKHDVHGLKLDALLALAQREAAEGWLGTYLFMAPDHPLTISHYGFDQQVRCMHAVREAGHEIGLHIDPYFLMHHWSLPLAEVMRRIVERFAREDIRLAVGNMHGNSRHKHADLDGRGTMFDLFAELGRQPDFPELARVPRESAEIIRAQRVSVRDYGFAHWADMPVWSARHGFVVTHFVTDNQLGKLGTVETLVQEDCWGAYKLCDRQTPGSRSSAAARALVRVSDEPRGTAVGVETLPWDSQALTERLRGIARQPTLMLIHPEFYCA
jgi:hypothetical protein